MTVDPLAEMVAAGAIINPTDPHAPERFEPEDGDERRVGTVTESRSVGPLRRTKALARDAIGGRMDPVEDGPPNPADRLLIPVPPKPSDLVIATDIYDVFRKVGR